MTKSSREHFIIYSDKASGRQIWQWVRREPGKPIACREHRFDAKASGEALIQRISEIAVPLEEEESFTLTQASTKVRKAFDVDKVTKKFYEQFKTEHGAFQEFITGIASEHELQWYTSLMLNRLMFVYFIQRKGFLDGDIHYLRNRMKSVQELRGKDQFHSFYQYFLVRLFHEGLGKTPKDRKLERQLEKLLGVVPYLNGGFFEVHQLKERNKSIEIPDEAFQRLFDFFDQWEWHLDDREGRTDNEINPDVVGYIFEKYINQKLMGAYYTKEDITEYSSKNTIIPFLFDSAKKKCPSAFKPESSLWQLLSDNPDRYIYAAVRHGVIDHQGHVIPLPKDIAGGIKNVEKRENWNRPASDPFALPTETWREHVARRTRCLELRKKLQSGEVHEINDLITLNLDIWQFARDTIVNCEGPELLRAFWHAIQSVTVLDPTCGSGAFLFAALRILETLYSDCLERMERFTENADSPVPGAAFSEAVAETPASASGKRKNGKASQIFSDFRKVLEQITEHRGQKYFILKSIIINNLFGVDIMEEAVEICKLRLFLKLVAQVDKADQIEPLPDIDFNIRAGNTLVGYVSLDEIRRAIQQIEPGVRRLVVRPEVEEDLQRVEEDALAVEKCFKQFRSQQITHGGIVRPKDKEELRNRLSKLANQLDRYLAGEYGVNVNGKKQTEFDAWKTSHQPFHWFAEFYGIMSGGGFDVVIGNPPWMEYAAVRKSYTVRSYATESCGNLHVLCTERALSLKSLDGRLSFIVQLPLTCSSRMQSVRSLLQSRSDALHVVSFDDRPGKLFDGLQHCRSVIFLSSSRSGARRGQLLTTRYQRWPTEARNTLFAQFEFAHVTGPILHPGVFPKYATDIEVSAFRKVVEKSTTTIGQIASARSQNAFVFYQEATQYWVKAVIGLPYYAKDGVVGAPAHGRYVYFADDSQAAATCAIMNSSVFYAYFIAYGDCFHLSDTLVTKFPVLAAMLEDELLVKAGRSLNAALKKSAIRKSIKTRDGSEISYAEFRVAECKPILDEIDERMADYYELTSEESSFLINYDIKYRMGQSDEDDEE